MKYNEGKPSKNIPKAMVTSLYGHEDMIDYLSSYRTQDKMHGKHYVPRGSLFWFTCNQYGDFTGSCFFIKNVPDENLMKESYLGTGYRTLAQRKKKVLSFAKSVCTDKRLAEGVVSHKKPKLHQ